MNLTKEHKECCEHILSEAPEGSTHNAVLQYDCTPCYLRIKGCRVYTLDVDGKTWGARRDFDLNGFYEIRDLDDIRESLNLHNQIEILAEKLKQFTAKQVCCGHPDVDYDEQSQSCCGMFDEEYPEDVKLLLEEVGHD